MKREFPIKVRWVAFPLHPETPEEGMTLSDLFAGQDLNIPAIMAQLNQVAAELGLPFGDRAMTFNSLRATEMAKWAETQGKGPPFHQAVFESYFGKGHNIAQVSVLRALAESVGLDGREAVRVLDEGLFHQAVDDDWAYSRSQKVRAVPTFQIAGNREVGAKPYETLRALVLKSGGGTK